MIKLWHIALHELPLWVKSISTGSSNTAPVFIWYLKNTTIYSIGHHYIKYF